MMHVHNELLRNATFGNVYWFTASEDFSIHKLQNEIAKEVGLDFEEEDKRKRATKLHKGILRRKQCVIVLDGLSSSFDQDDVGIPSQVKGCKLIITTRSLMLCRRMDCRETIKIEPLSVAEAETLFKEKLGVKNPVTSGVEEIAEEVVEECEGLPSKLLVLLRK
ncbi:hypothetical protein JCGZ_00686 [Jatropha curcas]|uniref:NB-ARC domain-containing protein n=1 Tax=Jatropha curcas TaxID=180498 RepID=A0A067L499_JATCU|nr:hypothetical protein JCGZ_00686 [Jatropha curcas]